jgi:hypothetical protein
MLVRVLSAWSSLIMKTMFGRCCCVCCAWAAHPATSRITTMEDSRDTLRERPSFDLAACIFSRLSDGASPAHTQHSAIPTRLLCNECNILLLWGRVCTIAHILVIDGGYSRISLGRNSTGGRIYSPKCVEGVFREVRARNAAWPRPNRTRTAGEGTSCSMGIMAHCARTNGSLDSGLRVRFGDA